MSNGIRIAFNIYAPRRVGFTRPYMKFVAGTRKERVGVIGSVPDRYDPNDNSIREAKNVKRPVIDAEILTLLGFDDDMHQYSHAKSLISKINNSVYRISESRRDSMIAVPLLK